MALKFITLNYQAESSTISSLIKDWENDVRLTEGLELLHLSPWKVELTASNGAFMDLYTSRTQELGAKSLDTLKIKRTEAMAAYELLIKVLEARAILDGNGMYTKIINEINALIEQYKTMLNDHSNARSSVPPTAE
jgi:hypothetical protein